MKIITPILRGVLRLKLAPELSREAHKRLKWFDYYETHNHNARLTCRHFGISPQTFYRWKGRYDPGHLSFGGRMEDHSHRPRRVRQPTYTQEEVEAVLKMRESFSRRRAKTSWLCYYGEKAVTFQLPRSDGYYGI